MMRDAKKAVLAAVEQKKELLEQVSDSIWEYAELSLQEYRSAALFCQVLTQQGFAVAGYLRYRNGVFRQLWQRQTHYRDSGGIRCPVGTVPEGRLHGKGTPDPRQHRPRLRP